MDHRRAEAIAWQLEMFESLRADAPPPTDQRQAEFETWLLDAANREMLVAIRRPWELLGTLLALPAPRARELLGDAYEPELDCLVGGKTGE